MIDRIQTIERKVAIDIIGLIFFIFDCYDSITNR